MNKFFLSLLLLISSFVFAQKGDKFSINGYLVKFPSKMEVIEQHRDSGAFLFSNKKENYGVSIRDVNIMEFYDANLNNIQLLEAFYQWDFEHWKNNSIGAKTEEITTNLEEKYIIWNLIVNENHNTLLFGIIDDKIVSISTLNKTDSQKEVNKKLIDLYKNITKHN